MCKVRKKRKKNLRVIALQLNYRKRLLRKKVYYDSLGRKALSKLTLGSNAAVRG